MINLSMAEPDNMLRPRITVIGVGGGGGNAINNMVRSNLEGCEFVAANTDAQALAQSLAGHKVQLGSNLSRGLGAGSKPDIGRAAAEESMADILSILEGSDMLFVTAGMGGGTGTGAAPVIARAAREAGILTVGVVTKPFHFEGTNRMRQAESGIEELQQYVDTLIVIPNQNLFRIANERTTFAEAFRMADEVLHSGVRGITDLMIMPGFMNLDFADVKTVMGEMGKAMMGTGEAEGDNRAILAAESAISNPLLDDISMKGARGVLINITGGMDMTLFEVDQAANRIREEVDPEAQIKVGSTLGEGLDGRIRVSVIATGIDIALEERAHRDTQQSSSSAAGTNTRAVGMSSDVAAKPTVRVLGNNQPTQQRMAQPVKAQAAAPVRQPAPAPQQQTTVSMSMDSSAPASSMSNAYFTMPASITPQMMGKKAPQPSFGSKTTASSMNVSMPMEKPVEQVQQSRPAVRQIEVQEEAPAVSQASTANYRPTTVPPVREIQPVQQASRQRTAQAGTHSEENADMRVTQLTTESAAPQETRGAHLNQRAQSLFQRITGFGMIRPSRNVSDEIDEEVEENIQSSLGIDQTDRPVLSTGEADLLDIPAFLRRQTNH